MRRRERTRSHSAGPEEVTDGPSMVPVPTSVERSGRRLPTRTEIASHPDLYRVAYLESQRTLDDQRDEIRGLRDRSVQFMAFVGAATAFLVGVGLHASTRDALFYGLSFGASALSLVTIVLLFSLLNPNQRKMWHYRMSANILIADWIEKDVPQPSEADLLRALAEEYDQMSENNEHLLGRLRSSYRWFVIIGAAQLITWAALVWAKS